LQCKNPVEAKKWFLKAAISGDADGAFHLGILYERGAGNKAAAETEKALACYQLSSKRIHAALNAKGNKNLHQLKPNLERSESGVERASKALGGRGTTLSCY
jgi:TPR repeat protein